MKLLTTNSGRLVEVIEVEHGSDPCDSFIQSAVYIDNGLEVEEDTLQELTESYAEEIGEAWYQHQVGRAEYSYED